MNPADAKLLVVHHTPDAALVPGSVAGGKGMPGWPDLRLSHLFSFTCQW
jgi:hypothetical protein